MASHLAPRRQSLQAQKQEVVRQEIWNAAIELFHARGFDEVAAARIASHAGLSRRTFFRYFSSKEDVLASSVKAYGEALIDIVGNDRTDAPSAEVAKRAIIQILEPHLPTTERVIQIAKQSVSARNAHLLQTPDLQRELAKAFATRRHGEASSQPEDRILANLALCATELCVELWVAEPHRPLPEIVQETFERFSRVWVN